MQAVTAQQVDLEEHAPTPEYAIMNGLDDDLEAEINEVIHEVKNAIRTTMRIGKLVRVKKNKPCEWQSLDARLHLIHARVHGNAALGRDDLLNEDGDTGLPNLWHEITREGMALVRLKHQSERIEARSGGTSENIPD
jgi:hypothetical protein